MSSRLIRGHEGGDDFQAWRAPEVNGPTLRGGHHSDGSSTRAQSQRDGFEEGRRAGLEAARKEVAAQANALERALDALSRPFDALDQRFHEEILELVKAVARQLVRREMRIDPSHIVGVVRDGLAALPLAASDITVCVHPDDAAVLRECLPQDAAERSWHIEPDPLLDRGGCVILTPQSQVDGRLETRLARVIAAMFEDARATNEASDPAAG